jgi:hypothetical protein
MMKMSLSSTRTLCKRGIYNNPFYTIQINNFDVFDAKIEKIFFIKRKKSASLNCVKGKCLLIINVKHVPWRALFSFLIPKKSVD